MANYTTAGTSIPHSLQVSIGNVRIGPLKLTTSYYNPLGRRARLAGLGGSQAPVR